MHLKMVVDQYVMSNSKQMIFILKKFIIPIIANLGLMPVNP